AREVLDGAGPPAHAAMDEERHPARAELHAAAEVDVVVADVAQRRDVDGHVAGDAAREVVRVAGEVVTGLGGRGQRAEDQAGAAADAGRDQVRAAARV